MAASSIDKDKLFSLLGFQLDEHDHSSSQQHFFVLHISDEVGILSLIKKENWKKKC